MLRHAAGLHNRRIEQTPVDPIGSDAVAPGLEPSAAWAPVWTFVAKVLGGLLVGAAGMAVTGFVSTLASGLMASAPPRVRANVDALIPPVLGWLVTALFVAAALHAARGLRGAATRTCQRAALACVGLAVVLGAGLFVVTGHAIPAANPVRRQIAFTTPVAAEFPPHVLTNGELGAVQAWLREQGGYSQRIALTHELRRWCALSVFLIGLLAGEAVAGAPRARLGVRLLVLQGIAAVTLFFGIGLSVGPGVFLRPPRGPQDVAWVLLVLALGLAAWRCRRAFADRSPAAPSAHVGLSLDDQAQPSGRA